MGAKLSLNIFGARVGGPDEFVPIETCKKRKLMPSCWEENQRLISSLPDEISIQILARVPRIHYLRLKLVSRAWKHAITSNELFQLRQELGTAEEWLYILTKVKDGKLVWYAMDPQARRWQKLPPMPTVSVDDESKKGLTGQRIWNMAGSSMRIADAIMAWLGRKDALDQMPFCGCAVGAIDGCLYVLGGFSSASAMRCVWRYDPIANTWNEAHPMSIGRAYCKTTVLNNKLYVVGGVTRGNGGLSPLQSAEVYDPSTGMWSEMPSMPFAKAQVLPTAFLADLLKPIATGLTSYRGKLFVPQSLYCWPFFVDVGGEVYDPDVNTWVEMPMGMGEGWPARQAGTKLSVTVNGELYALDPSSSLDNAKVKVYDSQSDAWKVVAEDIPIHDFSDSESPYLLAGLTQKLHVITKDANNNITVMQAGVRNHHLASFPSASSSSSSQDICFRELHELEEESENFTKVIATRTVGSAELVSCQTLVI